MSEGVSFDEAEALLESAEFEDVKLLWHSSNYVYLCQLCGGEGEPIAAVYKPHRGESPLWDFPDGLYRREVAAYRLARLLSWDFIPPTVVRDGPQGVGSLQLFVAHDTASHFFEQRDKPELLPQLRRMAVFDYVANNADRKGGHCLLDEHGRIWGIDHGICFHEQYKMRTVMWDWAEEPIPQEWLDDIRSVGERVRDRAPETAPLLKLISGAEREAMLGRIGKLLHSGAYPAPGPHRHYPWPLV